VIKNKPYTHEVYVFFEDLSYMSDYLSHTTWGEMVKWVITYNR